MRTLKLRGVRHATIATALTTMLAMSSPGTMQIGDCARRCASR